MRPANPSELVRTARDGTGGRLVSVRSQQRHSAQKGNDHSDRGAFVAVPAIDPDPIKLVDLVRQRYIWILGLLSIPTPLRKPEAARHPAGQPLARTSAPTGTLARVCLRLVLVDTSELRSAIASAKSNRRWDQRLLVWLPWIGNEATA